MSEPTRPIEGMSAGSRCFAEVLRSELTNVLPDLSLPPINTPGNPADERRLEHDTIGLINTHPTDLAALCLSGGGIRSATFALGVIQGLARFGLLGQFHYLSTVSGGGYIGSWLTAWRTQCRDEEIFAALNESQHTGTEPEEIVGLRSDSNYLTPSLGILSADTWTLIALYMRNLVLNWLLFVPFFMGCLLVPFVCRTVLEASRSFACPSAGPLIAGCAALTFGLAFAVYGRFRRADSWLTQTRFLLLVLAPVVISAMCFTAAGARAGDSFPPGSAAAGLVVGALIYFISWACGRFASRRYGRPIQWADLCWWVLSGAVVGLLIGIEIQTIAANIDHPSAIVALGLSGMVTAYLTGEILYVGLASRSPHGEVDREWLARAAGWLAAFAVSWAVISAIALYGPPILQSGWGKVVTAGAGSISGLITLLLGSSARTAATQAGEALKTLSGKSSSPLRIASIAAVVFAVLLAALLSLWGQLLIAPFEWLLQAIFELVKLREGRQFVADAMAGQGGLHKAVIEALLGIVLIGLAFGISWCVNVNRFSMHALYRNRLVRAFLGSARATLRKPDPFTGFDFGSGSRSTREGFEGDNLRMSHVPKGDKARLFHVIITALNVVSSKNPAWQERKAESFTITRLYCGNGYVRYQPTQSYGGNLTLGTAMAISGAAVSPNQGYNSSPLVGFLLTLFNVRLGWWLGSPRKKHYRLEGPMFGITPSLAELAGATTDEGKWIYLSDGGHFDNLGLYEMVRRRCRFIMISDAGCDPHFTFEDLGNAVRKIFIDFGVSIDFNALNLEKRQTPPRAAARFAIGKIKYPETERCGWLVYIKPTYQATIERADVRSYASAHEEFPHESTTDQWFSESQLEAYRALGARIIEAICCNIQDAEEGRAGARGGKVPPGTTPAPMSLESLRDAAQKLFTEQEAARA